jgi:hypothetical protein
MNMQEFIHQSERYQALDGDGLNQVYKFFLYNNVSQGTFISHPFTVERVQYLRDWADSDDYRQIRSGHYRRTGEGAVNVEPTPPQSADDVETLRREVETLQREIDRIKRSRPEI